ncbi:MAG: hypothetical protein FWC80_03170 [Firmicutes bacterium]|nr:hypothetical protein [Bacillota bacterium]
MNKSEEFQVVTNPEFKFDKVRTPEEQRIAEIKALKKERAHNNARIQAELIARGELPVKKRRPPKPPVRPVNNIEHDINEKLTHIIKTVVKDGSEADDISASRKNAGTGRDNFANGGGNSSADNSEIKQMREDVADLKGAIQALVMQREKQNAQVAEANRADLASGGKTADNSEITQVRADVANLTGAMQMLVTHLAKPNTHTETGHCSSCSGRLAHMETAACYHARMPYGVAPQFIQLPHMQTQPLQAPQPQVIYQPSHQSDNGEMDRMRSEMSDVKDAVNNLVHTFSSYNLSKANSVAPQVPPQIIVNTPPPQQVQQAPAQPIILNGTTPPQGNGHTSVQPIIINSGPPHGNGQSGTNYGNGQPGAHNVLYTHHTHMQKHPEQPTNIFNRNGASDFAKPDPMSKYNGNGANGAGQSKSQPESATSACVGSSGLSAKLAKMCVTLDGLCEDIK